MILDIDGQFLAIGKWRGHVTSTEDPLQQFRIRATVPDVLEDVESNWALPCFEGGSDDPKLPKVGQMVWIEFEQGDPNKPIWTGCMPSSYQGNLAAPAESRGEDGDTVQPPRGTAETETASGKTVQEPVTAFVGEYGSVKSFKSESGHHIEVDDTPGEERVAVIHKSGAAVEMNNTGALQQRLNRNSVTVAGDEIYRIMGKKVSVIDGVVEEECRREVTKTTLGKLKQWLGDDVEVVLNGATTDILSLGTLNLRTDGRINMETGANLQQKTAGTLQQTAMGAHQVLITENAEEIVGNSSLSFYGKSTKVLAGGYNLETVLGPIVLKTLPGIPIMIGDPILATEPAVLGNAFMVLYNTMVTMFNAHTHPDPTSGVTGPPLTAFAPMVAGVHTSLKVLLAR